MLEVLFWVVQMCAVHTCKTEQVGATGVITICAPPNKPVPEKELHKYRKTFKDVSSDKALIIQIQNCTSI